MASYTRAAVPGAGVRVDRRTIFLSLPAKPPLFWPLRECLLPLHGTCAEQVPSSASKQQHQHRLRVRRAHQAPIRDRTKHERRRFRSPCGSGGNERPCARPPETWSHPGSRHGSRASKPSWEARRTARTAAVRTWRRFRSTGMRRRERRHSRSSGLQNMWPDISPASSACSCFILALMSE